MYDEGLVGNAYRSIEMVRSSIKWQEIASTHKVTKSFSSVMRSLKSKGLVGDQGKSGAVYSLTIDGIRCLRTMSL